LTKAFGLKVIHGKDDSIQPANQKYEKFWIGGRAHVIKHEAMSSNPSTSKKKEKRKILLDT
jgi:hypothetical protein